MSGEHYGLHRTELLKLAAAINCPASQLEGLNDLKASELRKLRLMYQNAAFTRFAPLCKQLATASRLLPKAVSAQMAEKVFGPQLTAHVLVHLPAKQFIAIVERLDDEFLGNLLNYLDSRRASTLIAALPQPLAERFIESGLSQHNYPALAELAEQLPREQVLGLAEALKSPLDLIRISRFITDKSSLTQLVSGLDENLISNALLAAGKSNELAEMALELLSFMPVDIQQAAAAQGINNQPEATRQLADLATRHPQRHTLEAFIQTCS